MDEARITRAQVWHTDSQESTEIINCLICRDEDNLLDQQSERPSKTLRCHPQHIFHEECIDEWSKVENTCPVCRTFLDPLTCCQKCRIVTKNCLDDKCCPITLTVAYLTARLPILAMICLESRGSNSEYTNPLTLFSIGTTGFCCGLLTYLAGQQCNSCCEDWKKLK
jgi:hypothetical protein